MPPRGVTTGISAADRARTVQVFIDPASASAGSGATGPHLSAGSRSPAACCKRAGHTEAVVDLCRAAGLLSRGSALRDHGRGRRHGAHAAAARDRRSSTT